METKQHTAAQVTAITYAYVRCNGAGRGKQVAQLLATVPQSAAESVALSRMTVRESSCLERAVPASMADGLQFNFDAMAMRGPYAELLLKQVQSGQQQVGKLPVPFDMKAAWASKDSEEIRKALILLDFAECVRKAAPAPTAQLLAAEPESAAESAAIGALRPAMTACFPAGATLKVNKLVLRGNLAEASYRALFAPSAAQ